MKLYFSHGKESGPWGTKIRRLAPIARDLGYAIESVDYSDLADQEARAERLLELLAGEDEPCVLVGSSMGGYVSLVAAAEIDVRAVFLMAPALYIPGYRVHDYRPRAPRIEVVHGWADAVIPVENSIRFARAADCTLHLVSGDHGLNGSLEVVSGLFEDFLRRL